MEKHIGLMGKYIKDNTKMTKSTVMDNLYGKTVDHMKENGLTENNTEKE